MSALALSEMSQNDATTTRNILRLVSCGTYDSVADRFMNGGCLAFAYALWIAHDCRADASIAILSDEMADGWGDIDHDATHAYLDMPSGEIDVRGIRTPAAMAEDLDLDAWTIAAEMHPDDAVATYAGGFLEDVEEGDHPISLKQDDIVDALVHIANHPKRYGLGE